MCAFFIAQSEEKSQKPPAPQPPAPSLTQEQLIRQQLLAKQKQLLELQQKKIELELEQTKAQLVSLIVMCFITRQTRKRCMLIFAVFRSIKLVFCDVPSTSDM